MSKSTIAFEWQDVDEGRDLPPIPISESAPHEFRSGPERRLLIGGAALLLAIALLASQWTARQAQIEQAQLHEELARAVDAEAREAGSLLRATLPSASIRRDFAGIENRAELAEYHASLAGSAPSSLAEIASLPREQPQEFVANQERTIAVEVQALQEGMAAVLVVTDAYPLEDGRASPHRQLRFYRRTEQGWQPTEPAPALWGQPQRLATEHFDFTYRSRDAQAVQAVAVELDALYEQARRNFGLPPAPDRKTPISIVVGTAPGKRVQPGNELQDAHQEIIVSSPALLLAPESLTDAAILRQSILLPLLDKAITEAASTHSLPPRWVTLLTPMRLWQIWDLGGPLAAGRDPVYRWLYGKIQMINNDTVAAHPAQIAELCALHTLWRVAPGSRGGPLFCSEMDQAAFEMVLTTTQLDYVAATYGRDHIGALWPILHEHENWDTLIPAGFGVSLDEFIAGWHAYLAEIAGIAPQ